MKTITLITLIFLFPVYIFGQAPFTTPVLTPIKLEVGSNEKGERTYTVVDNETKTSEKVIETKQSSFFNTNSLSLSLLNKGENRLSISSQVIHYKLYIANPTEDSFQRRQSQTQEEYSDRIRKYKINIPLLLISKISSTNDSINSSGSIDLLDYEAAPITLRIMPSFNIPLGDVTDKLLFGFYTDMRALNIRNNATDEYNFEIMGSGGIGFTYQGDGEVGTYNENGDYSKGKYSISTILQGATGKKEIIQQLFKTDKDYVASFQSYFVFNSLIGNSMNLKIGYQYYFKETIGGSKSTFSIALGI